MKSMPVKIKDKLRQLQKYNEKANILNKEIEEMFAEYEVDTDYLRALGGYGTIQTEGLTFIDTCEGDVEDNIKDIEEVFLHYVNQDKN